MSYLIPSVLVDTWAYTHHYHTADAVYLMEVPLQVNIVEQDEDDPQSFKAQTYRDIVEFSSWYVREHMAKPSHLSFVLRHEVRHQQLMHHLVLDRWERQGHVTGKRSPMDAPVTYPFVNWVAQHAFDYQINDGMYSCGDPMPEDALHNRNLGKWTDLENDIYIRVFATECIKQGIDPKSQELNADGTPQQGKDEGDRNAQGGQAPQPAQADAGQGEGAGDAGQGQTSGSSASQQPGSNQPGLTEPSDNRIGRGGSDVVASQEGEERFDAMQRRAEAFKKMMAELDPEKFRGIGSGDIEKLFQRTHPRKMPWHELVRPQFRSLLGGRTPTWSTFDRAAFAKGYTLQGRVMKRAGFVVQVFDTSGSVNRAETSAFVHHTQAMYQQCMPRQLLVLEIDDTIQRDTWVRQPGQLRSYLDPMFAGKHGLRGNGGTDMRLWIDYLVKHDLHPDLVMILTDGGTPFPTHKGYAKNVLWLITRPLAYTPVPEGAGRAIQLTI